MAETAISHVANGRLWSLFRDLTIADMRSTDGAGPAQEGALSQVSKSKGEGHPFPRVMERVVWLRGRRNRVLGLTLACIAVALLLDLLIPGYAIAGFYLVPLMLVAFAVYDRLIVAVVGVALPGPGRLHDVPAGTRQRSEHPARGLWRPGRSRSGRARATSISASTSSTRPRGRPRPNCTHSRRSCRCFRKCRCSTRTGRSRPCSTTSCCRRCSCSGCDGGVLFRFDSAADLLRAEATVGVPRDMTRDLPMSSEQDPAGRAARERRPVANTGPRTSWEDDATDAEAPPIDWIRDYGACIAVPLMVGADLFGVIALYYRDPRVLSREDVSLAQSFGDQAALAIENARLREQVERSAVDAERLRLARDLHDSVTQSLFAASLQAEALRRGVAAGLCGDAAESGRRPAPHPRRPRRDARRCSWRCVQPRWRSRRSTTSCGTSPPRPRRACGYRSSSPSTSPRRSPPDVTIALYRIAQEALNNVVRHSKARNAWVNCPAPATILTLVVGDDGRGFDPRSVGPGTVRSAVHAGTRRGRGGDAERHQRRSRGTVVTAATTVAPGVDD